MDNLPPADPNADPASAPVLVLRAPPQPAPRKPEVPARMLADWPSTPAQEALGELLPEFAAAPLPQPAALAELPPRSAQRRVGAAGDCTFSARWSRYTYKKKNL